MKTIKYVPLIATVLAIGACSNDDQLQDSTVAVQEYAAFSSTIGDELAILPTENLDGNATRSTLDSKGEFTEWTVGDKVSISDGTLSYAYKVNTVNGKTCTFAVIDENHKEFEAVADKVFYAAYPAAAVKGWNGSTVSEQIYAEQNYEENVNGGVMGAYMVTSTTADESGKVSFTFNHTASVIEVNLATLGVTPKAVYLKSNSGVAIAGQLKCNAENRNITVVANDGTAYNKSLQSDVIALTNIASDATIARFYVLPVLLEGGVTVTVMDNNGNYYTKTTSTDVGTADGAGFTLVNSISKESDQLAIPTHTACKPYYKKVNFGAASTATRKNNWMATIPGNIHFNLLSVPGAHDACTKGNAFGSSAECQDLTLQELLDAGVRCVDFRPAYLLNETITADNLYIWHGVTKTSTKYVDAIKILADFLAANPTEVITVVMTKENNKSSYINSSYTDRSEEMWNVLRACHNEYLASFKVLDHSYYDLNDFRGKICYINRTGTTGIPGTVNITNWPDNGTVSDWSCKIGGTCSANVQDKYNSNGTTKQNAVKEMLGISSNNTDTHNFTFNYTSSANSPSSYAKSTNPAIATYLNGNNINGSTGYLLCDYIGCSKNSGDVLLKAIVNQNYKYIFSNRSRNNSVSSTPGIGVEVAGDEYADESTVYARKR